MEEIHIRASGVFIFRSDFNRIFHRIAPLICGATCAFAFLWLPQWEVKTLSRNDSYIWLLMTIALNCAFVIAARWHVRVNSTALEWLGGIFGWILVLVFSICYGEFPLATLIPLAAAILPPNRWATYSVVFLGILGLYFLRKNGMSGFGLWWIASTWVRLVILQFSRKREQMEAADRFRSALFFLFAPPFLLSPLPMKWIQYDYLADSKVETNPEDSRKAACALLAGIGVSVLYFIESESSALSGALVRLHISADAINGPHLGYLLFIKRFLLFWGITEITRAWFLLAGFRVKNDYSRPYLARNPMEFWSSYSGYAKDFLLQNVFLRTLLKLPRRTPTKLALPLSLFPVFGILTFDSLVSPISSVGAPFGRTYSLQASLEYTGIVFIWILLFTHLYSSSRKFVENQNYRQIWQIRLHNIIFWLVTQVSIGFIFWSSYKIRWVGTLLIS